MKGLTILQGLTVSPSPHINDDITTKNVMLHVLIALLPATVASGIIFGIRAILLIVVCCISAVLWEYVCRIFMKKGQTISDLSAVITGLLLAMNLPVTLPLYMAVIGTFVAIVIVKQLFGGLGQNFANPAIVGRIVLMLSFPIQMTNWVKPFYYKTADLVTAATPLNTDKVTSYRDLLLGNTGGCLGETCAIALIIGGVYLVSMKIISTSTPLAYIGTIMALSLLGGEDPIFQVLSGGLLIGAIFMATDYVTTPITKDGKLIFGIGCGLITFALRKWGSYPEGVSFAILLMNIATPYIDKITKTKPLGAKKLEKAIKEVK